MIAAVQLGALAACVVVLVPMGLAGWHLSRNKVLFFSGALFISLAIAVHLSPYFPSLNDFLPSASTASTTVVVLNDRRSCFSLLHRVRWSRRSLNSSKLGWDWSENNSNVVACEFQKVGRDDAGDLLNGSWVMVAGDSQARLFVVSLLNLVLLEEEMGRVRGDLFKRHSDYHLVVDRIGLQLDFIWAPYVEEEAVEEVVERVEDLPASHGDELFPFQIFFWRKEKMEKKRRRESGRFDLGEMPLKCLVPLLSNLVPLLSNLVPLLSCTIIIPVSFRF